MSRRVKHDISHLDKTDSQMIAEHRSKNDKETNQNDAYDKYLQLLQKKNKIIKQLQQKDANQVELERKEQGFSLYLNGANATPVLSARGQGKGLSPQDHQFTRQHFYSKRNKTAEDRPFDPPQKDSTSIINPDSNQTRRRSRANTAPEKNRRKNWAASSINIKTDQGDDFKLQAPGIFTGKYEDDFEIANSQEKCYDSLEEDIEENLSGSFEDLSCVDEELNTGSEVPNGKVGLGDSVLLSVSSVKKLRESLEMNSLFKLKLAEPYESDSESDSELPIPEEIVKQSNLVSNSNCESLMDPKNLIVLDFSPSQTKVLQSVPSKVVNSTRSKESTKKKINNSKYSQKKQDTKNDKKTNPSSNLLSKNIVSTQSTNNSEPSITHRDEEAELLPKSCATPVSKEQPVNSALDDEKMRTGGDFPQPRVTHSAPMRKNATSPESNQRSVSVDHLKSSSVSEITAVDDSVSTSRLAWPRDEERSEQAQLDSSDRKSPDDINKIVQKVLHLDAKGQRKLLKALAQIEDTCTLNSSSEISLLSSIKSVNSPLPSASQIVEFHLRSNWGHQRRIGLTEIQLFDTASQQVDVDSVTVTGASDVRGDIQNIFNGKTKTVRRRNMWSSKYKSKCKIVISVKVSHQNGVNNLGHIKLWNYNQSINELTVGVKDLRILVDNTLVFDGLLDKGCGNQVFDYHKAVVFSDPTSNSDVGNTTSYKKGTSDQKENLKSSFVNEQSNTNINDKDLRLSHKERFSPVENPVHFNHTRHSDVTVPSTKTATECGASELPTTTESLSLSKTKASSSNNSNNSVSSDTDLRQNSNFDDCSSPLRSQTRLLNRSSIENIPIIKADETIVTSNQPKKSEGQPKVKKSRKSKSPRKSKMAARLDGSTSSIDSSLSTSQSHNTEKSVNFNSISNSKIVESSHLVKSNRVSTDVMKAENNSENEVTTTKKDELFSESRSASVPACNSNNCSPSVGIASKLSVLTDHKVSCSPGSDDDLSMLNQLRNITRNELDQPKWLQSDKKLIEKKSSINAPTVIWLNTDLKTEDSEKANKSSDRSLKVESIFSDVGSGRSTPTHGRRSANPSHATVASSDFAVDDQEESLWLTRSSQEIHKKSPPPSERNTSPLLLSEQDGVSSKMSQIQSARSEWREKEEANLEASWASLNVFNRSQKGRLSVDTEISGDILSEYFGRAAVKPNQPTIKEEDKSALFDSDSLHLSLNEDNENEFTIPELPSGLQLTFNIKTTWGDKHYVGLSGIEIFLKNGEPARIHKISADPPDINILPGNKDDPRVVSNLIDGMNRTRDDTHMWLAPFTKNGRHLIKITFEKTSQIALMRIWNYNKSRIHSDRGVRDVDILLDNQLIFQGEIARACGGVVGGSESFGDTILFTMDEEILELVSKYDKTFESEFLLDVKDESLFMVDRPLTADLEQKERPFTSASKPNSVLPGVITSDDNKQSTEEVTLVKGKRVSFNFTHTWGDSYYLGLTGIQIIDSEGESIPISIDLMDANPRDLHVLPGYERDDRTLDKLIDGVNVTMSDEHMWLIPFTDGDDHCVYINFSSQVTIGGFRFWNYNKSAEDTYRGAKIVHITVDDRRVSPPAGFLIRKGPGNCYFDFAQEVHLFNPKKSVVKQEIIQRRSIILDEPSQDYENVHMPCGFIYQFHLLSTWGDSYYIGLNGLEFYDNKGNKIELFENNISAYPDSVNVLEGVSNDLRTPDKLIDGHYETGDGKHTWLSPILPSVLNRVYVIFDEPMEVSMIKLWNYSKTASRGVKDFALLVDDLLVYNGTLGRVGRAPGGILPTCEPAPPPYHTIIFSADAELRRREKHTLITNIAEGQDVQLLNDHKVVSHYSDPKTAQTGKVVDQELRPQTCVTGRVKVTR